MMRLGAHQRTAFISVAVLISAAAFAAAPVLAQEDAEEHGTPHYPLEVPERQEWSFDGPFGKYDAEQLQRGLQVYRMVCGNCHGLRRVAFRTLSSETGPFLSDARMRDIAVAYSVVDQDSGETRPGRPADVFPTPPFPGQPPDLSLMAKARGVGEGFRWMLDGFTLYQEGGVDYIYGLLTGYQDPPAGFELQAGLFYNPFFVSDEALSMPPPLRDGGVAYGDGTLETVEQYAADVSAFLMWAAEPKLVDRKRLGLQVMVFLIGFAILAYLAKRRIWAREH